MSRTLFSNELDDTRFAPTVPVRMNRDHRLSQGLVWSVVPGVSQWIDYAGVALPLPVTALNSVTGSNRGPGLTSQNATARMAYTPLPPALVLTSGITMGAHGACTGVHSSSNNSTILGPYYSAPVASPYVCYHLEVASLGGYFTLVWNAAGVFANPGTYLISSAVLPASGMHSIIGTLSFPDGSALIYLDDAQIGSAATTNAPSYSATSYLSPLDPGLGFGMVSGCIWNRVLDAEERAEYDATPFSMFERIPTRSLWWVGGGGGTLVTRDFSIPSLRAASIQRDESEALSWLTAMQRDAKMDSAWAATAVADQQARVNWTGALATDTTVSLAWLRDLTQDNQLPLSWQTREQIDSSASVGWASKNQADASLLINWTGTTGTATGVDSRFGVAWASQILANGPAELAWLAKSQTDAQLSLATETKLLSDTQLSPASSTRLLSDSALPVSWTQTTYAMLGAGSFPLAWTAAVAADALAPLAWLGPSALFYGVDAQAFPRGIAAQSFARGISALPGQGTARR